MPAEEEVVQLDSKGQGVEVEELARTASSTSTAEVAVSPNQAKEEDETVEEGLEAGLGGGLRRLATSGLSGGADGDSVEDGGGGGGRAPGGFGAEATGGRGGREASESDM
ncbi:hypothetical protein CNMCM5878_007995 [Aspergillus fumigatiaffinis]|nr:hypothetical protein CNMCM5878_007995 [Aspergillus fumigatiaffinis]